MDEHRTQLPSDLTAEAIRYGFDLLLPPGATPHRWRSADGRAASGGTVAGRLATFSWSGAVPPTADHIELVADGLVVAAIRIESTSSATITTTADTLAWPWLACERLPAARVTWETLHGLDLPPSWQVPRPSGRIDLMPSAQSAGRQQRTLAAVDVATGWALVGEVTLGADFVAAGPSGQPLHHP
jgi:hypothetical protein